MRLIIGIHKKFKLILYHTKHRNIIGPIRCLNSITGAHMIISKCKHCNYGRYGSAKSKIIHVFLSNICVNKINNLNYIIRNHIVEGDNPQKPPGAAKRVEASLGLLIERTSVNGLTALKRD